MHQPFYKDPVQGEYILPWTYLHAVKDYYDMPALVDSVPGARVTFNLVPSLLEQLLDYAAGEAADPFLCRARLDSADLSEEDRLFIIENFFSANKQRMIEPNRRYLELYSLAGHGTPGAGREALRRLGDQEIMDLQVWFYLAWTGEAARRRFPAFNELIRKGKHYSATDKDLLFRTQRELIAEIIPLYQRLQREGKVELSVSPYFHPILPLLCDTRSAKVALPKAALPKLPFRHPEDARSQVARALESFEKLFGFRPQGMWPSEGAVSDEALAIMAKQGVRWSASDEWVLSRTLPAGLGREHEALYHPYSLIQDGRDTALFFRDHTLSDLIGFTYSQWETGRAVADLVGRLKGIRQRCRSSRVVSIVMDGENAWEYFQDNGHPFLARLYGALTRTPGLQLATFSEVLGLLPERRSLSHVHPGSWINADYAIWVGHPEKNLGWDLLAKARQAALENNPEVASVLAGGDSHDPVASLICKSLYAAQGSDWFWWYGDDHFSAHAGSFDLLFRSHLMNVYRLLGLEVPDELNEPVKKLLPAGFVREPSGFITPSISGVADDYFVWLAAGLYDLTKLSSAMHASENLLQSFFYGFDAFYFYFRIDGVQSLEKLLRQGDHLSLEISHGSTLRLELGAQGSEAELLVKEGENWRKTGIFSQYRIGTIAEARLPLTSLEIVSGDRLLCQLVLSRAGQEAGRWPADMPLLLTYAGAGLGAANWEI